MFQIRDNSRRAKEVIGLLWINIGLSVVNIASLFFQRSLLVRLVDAPDTVDISTANLSDNIQRIIAIGVLLTNVMLIIYFIRWFRRAYFNLHQLPGSYASWPEGWAAGAWFVPILNLFRPYQIMREIWEGMQRFLLHRLGNQQSAAIVGWWWTFYVVMSIYSNLSVRYSFMVRGGDIQGLITSTNLDIIGEFISIPAAVLAMILVKRMSSIESELYFESQQPSDSVFGPYENDTENNFQSNNTTV